ncbi:MAG: RNA polymerase sigma factor [Myxococcota bacterium]
MATGGIEVTRPSFLPDRRLALVRGGGTDASSAGEPPHDDWAPLARAAGAGDPQALRTFLVSAGPSILRVVRRVLGSAHVELEDVAQECAFAVVAALPDFRGECSALHFVCRVSVLTAMNTRRRLRAAKRARDIATDVELENVASLHPDPEQRLSNQASMVLVRELMSTLPIEQAEALALHCVLGYTLAEMEGSSGVSRETWKSRLRLAKHAFRKRALSDLRARELIAPWEGDSA